MVKHTKVIYTFIIFSLIFYGCANQLPPGGGDVDTTPPEIIYSYPENGTTNYSENYFEVEFSEYVDKRSFREAIFISPTVEGEMEVSWFGKTATVSFPQGFKNNITYVVNIGTDVVDVNNKNRMAQSFSLIFSTGSEIDRRKISGKVFGQEIEGSLIFSYLLDNDSTDYLIKKPDYLSQVGNDGSFTLNGLAAGRYRIFAVKDQYKDLIFQPDQDLIGIPFSDVILNYNDSSVTGVNFFLFKADTTKPRLMEALMTDRKHILTKFSEETDSSTIKADNYRIVDSTGKLISNILYAYKGNVKKEEIILVPEEILIEQENFYLTADSITDKFGNVFYNDKILITQTERADTTPLKIIKTFPQPNSKIDYLNPEITIFFDDAFDKNFPDEAIKLVDSIGNVVITQKSFPDDATIKLIPAFNLKPDYSYLLTVDLKYFSDASGNKADSIYKIKFSTLSGLEFSGLSGNISLIDSSLVLVLESNTNSELKYYFKPGKKSAFNFERIEAGKYSLWAFEDKNSDGKYDFGWFNPFRFSEKFYVYPEIINLRPRWSLNDLLFKIE